LLKVFTADRKLLLSESKLLNNGKTTLNLRGISHNHNLLIIQTEIPETGEIKAFKVQILH